MKNLILILAIIAGNITESTSQVFDDRFKVKLVVVPLYYSFRKALTEDQVNNNHKLKITYNKSILNISHDSLFNAIRVDFQDSMKHIEYGADYRVLIRINHKFWFWKRYKYWFDGYAIFSNKKETIKDEELGREIIKLLPHAIIDP